MSRLDYFFFSCKMSGKIWDCYDTKIRGRPGGSALSKRWKANRREALLNLSFFLWQRARKIIIQQLLQSQQHCWHSFLAKPALCSWGRREGCDPWGPPRGWYWQGRYLSPFEDGTLLNPLFEQGFREQTPWEFPLNLPKLTEVKLGNEYTLNFLISPHQKL